MPRIATIVWALFVSILIWAPACSAQESPEQPPATQGMTNAHLGELVQRLDEDAVGQDGFWRFSYAETPLLLITDAQADRMRVVAPIAEFEQAELPPELLYRMLQANFDSALDARYAIARGTLWSTFIHPLSPLSDRQFLSGVGQTIALVKTFGTTFSSGAMTFGGGDSPAEIRELFDDLLEDGGAL